MGTPAAGGRVCGLAGERVASTGFPLSKSKSFRKSLSNLVCIISRPSSITSQKTPGTPELWPLNCPKLGFPHAKAKSFCPALIKLGLWLLNWPKTELAVSARIFCSQQCCHYH